MVQTEILLNGQLRGGVWLVSVSLRNLLALAVVCIDTRMHSCDLRKISCRESCWSMLYGGSSLHFQGFSNCLLLAAQQLHISLQCHLQTAWYVTVRSLETGLLSIC